MAPERHKLLSNCANSCAVEDRYFNRRSLAWTRAYSAARMGLEKLRRHGIEPGSFIVKKPLGPVMKVVSSDWSSSGRRGWLSNSVLNFVRSSSISGDFPDRSNDLELSRVVLLERFVMRQARMGRLTK
jgi:hypothetical protein